MDERTIRTTIVVDDELIAEAQRLTGIAGKSPLIRKALIARGSSRRLVRPGGSDANAQDTPRRRSAEQ